MVGRALARLASAAVVACALVCCALGGVAGAAPADLDRSFGANGIVAVRGPGGSPLPGQAGTRMAIGPRDEIFVLHSSPQACDRPFECTVGLTVARYTRDGDLDPAFGTGGPQLVVTQSAQKPDFDLAVGPDGKPVVTALDETGGLFVARLDLAGNLDGTFGAGGRAGHPAPGAGETARGGLSVAVGADGKAVTAAEGREGNLHVTRYLADGRFDQGFGGRGEVVLGLGTKSLPAEVLIGPDGSVTVPAPQCCVGGMPAFGGGFSVARLLADGQPGWGAGGHLFFPTPGAEGRVEGAALAPDGSLILSFEAEGGTVSTVGNVIKLLPDGRLDPGFGGEGRIQLFSKVGSVSPNDLVVDPSGRLVGVGWFGGAVLFRVRADGGKDRTFNGGQGLVLPGGASHSGSNPYSVGLQSGGRIVALGQAGRLIGLLGGTSGTRCQGRKATIVGTRRADELTGTPRRDVIAALAGKDKVLGLSGADLICGGRGTDEILSGPGRDSVQENPKEAPMVR